MIDALLLWSLCCSCHRRDRCIACKQPQLQELRSQLFDADNKIRLLREEHEAFLLRTLERTLPGSYVSLDASRAWLCYWCLHALDLLGKRPVHLFPRIIAFLSRCQLKSETPVAATAGRAASTGMRASGFGGGPAQDPHTAATYASVLALLVIGTPEAYAAIDRRGVYDFFMSIKDHPTPVPVPVPGTGTGAPMLRSRGGSGGFHVHPDGEMDVRGTYTVLAIATLLNIATPELTAGCADFLLACQVRCRARNRAASAAQRWLHCVDGMCAAAGWRMVCLHTPAICCSLDCVVALQTYEGGFSGEPGNEAHGGYAFCAVAGLALLGALHRADIPSLVRWLAARQLPLEGGFAGRCNKLVDGCYSFWQGATAAIVEGHLAGADTLASGAGAAAPAAVGAGSSRRAMLFREPSEWAEDAGATASAAAAVTAAGAAASTSAGSAAAGSSDAAGGVRRMLVRAASDGGGGGEGAGGVTGTRTLVIGPSVLPPAADAVETHVAAPSAAASTAALAASDGLPAVMNRRALQSYVLYCCQQPEGGLRDKPSKSRDQYHSCYCLAGLSAAQHTHDGAQLPAASIVGSAGNVVVESVHPVFNIARARVAAAGEHFSKQPAPEAW